MGSPNNNDFSWALVQLRDGKCVTREKWSYPGKHVGLVKQENIIPNPVDVQMDQPFFYLSGKQRQLAPWTPSHEDLLATDWEFA